MSSRKKFKLKRGIFQKLFWLMSVLFIIVILFIFFTRYISISKRFNGDKKIYEYVIDNNDVVKVQDFYYFKGKDVNNYVKYGNLMFRITKIYKDGSMDIITDKSINSLYNISDDVLNYVNDIFYESIPHEYLKSSPYCSDVIDDIKKITCKKIDFSKKVKLLPLIDYVNSFLDDETYLPNMWLGSKSSDGIWVSYDGGISSLKEDSVNYVYPVITLNNFVKYLSGDGTYENPFIIDSPSKVGGYLKINDDMYVINEDNGKTLKLSLVGEQILVRKMYSDNFINELNLDYYNNLSYKKILEKYKIGTYEYEKSYKDVNKDKKDVYVGMPMISDMNFSELYNDYYYVNSGQKIYYYNNGLKVGNEKLSMKVRPVIVIKSSRISSGTGDYDDPYLVEVK